MKRVVVLLAGIVWLVILVGNIYDLAYGSGSLSGVYFETTSAGDVQISGFRTGVDELGGLQTGDVVLAIGELSPPPKGHFALRNAIDHADGRLLIRRDSKVMELQYELQRYQWPAAIASRSAGLGVLAIMMLLYSHGALARTTAIALFTTASLGQGAPIGPTAEATALFTLTWCFGQALCYPSWINVMQKIVDPTVRGWPLIWPWMFSYMGLILYMNYTGQGLPHEYPWLIYIVSIILMMVTGIWLGLSGYKRAAPLGQRQLQWAITGALVVMIMLTGATIFDSLRGDAYAKTFLFVSSFGNVVLPMAFVIAIFKADIIPIDRAVVTTTTYAIIVVAIALALEFLIEPIVGLASQRFGMSESAGQSALIIGMALGAPWMKNQIRPHVLRLLRRYETE